MHTPHPPRPPYPPHTGLAPGESDEDLAARLREQPGGGTGHPRAVLLARHWAPVHDYAVICLASSASAAAMVTSAAFQQVLDRRFEFTAALRPQLLVTVRDTVRAWSTDEHISRLLPDLRKPAGARGLSIAKSMTPENRQLAFRSFQAMPSLAQCVLWHTEVEGEPISVPAGLLGVEVGRASASLEQARDVFRDGCVRAHRELAPTKECRYLNRLLDVPIRRGGPLLPDVEQHLLACRFCRHAADQLGHFDGGRGLGVLLAEAVLGWGARRYFDSRPGRESQGGRPRRHASRRGGGRRAARGGSHRLLSRIPGPGALRGRGTTESVHPVPTKVLITGIGVASVALLATFLAVEMWSDDGDGGPIASASASGRASVPGTGSDGAPPTSAGLPTADAHTKLRNVAADLCLDIRGGKATTGAAAKMSVCTDTETQQWSYEDDGRLRSDAEPDLCLDSNQVDGIAVLVRCGSEAAKNADDVRYDLTARGELIPRWQAKLALTPVTPEVNADVVVKPRDGSTEQHWVTDVVAATTEPQSLSAGSAASAT
ncbi:RICIN domain-containing protein [Streptomyces cavernae]|uniref:RICIN domain-containing protein n=1 Tax=Streptomyces cavernae TaxID=2259034 RepID=UPI000FEB97BB|nr:RICIN domain-containing protein [Streptomyces cavernae]